MSWQWRRSAPRWCQWGAGSARRHAPRSAFQAWKLSHAACIASHCVTGSPKANAQRMAVSGDMARCPCTSSLTRRREMPRRLAVSACVNASGARNCRCRNRPGCTGTRPGTPRGGAATGCVRNVIASVLERAVAGDHRADDALAAHDVFADRGVDVEDHEHDQNPHAQVVKGVHVLRLAVQRDHPAKQHVGPRPHAQALAVQREAGGDHVQRQQEVHREHRHARQRVVADIAVGARNQEGVPLQHRQHFRPVRGAEQGQREQLACVVVADKGPVDARREPDGEDVSSGEVGKADVPHQVVVAGLAGHRRQRRADEVTGHGQHGDRQCVDPMPQAHRCFVHVDRLDAGAAAHRTFVGAGGRFGARCRGHEGCPFPGVVVISAP
mmetsp:Transcript_32980/g.77363  ORF Transcript_32980/g.77363 Transcript_32980/m.77363 type:complete len:382 (-) Transcript_32980:326-1471(-)